MDFLCFEFLEDCFSFTCGEVARVRANRDASTFRRSELFKAFEQEDKAGRGFRRFGENQSVANIMVVEKVEQHERFLRWFANNHILLAYRD